MRKLSITGLAISMTFILSACSGQAQAETNPTTAMETTVSETTTEAETTEATTISETTVADMGKYGEYGKEAYELLKLNWVNGIYEDEAELRAQAPTILGSISEENLEIIIQELLSLDRPNSTSQSTPTQSTGESLTVPTSVESTKAPQPEPTQAPQPQQTTPAPQPTQAETQSQVNNVPPAAISQEEEDAIWDQAAKDLGLGEEVDASTKVTISDGISVDPEDNQGWNWH